MKRCYRVFSILFVLSCLGAVAVYAAPVPGFEATITLGRDPEPPICTTPNNAVTLFWDITHLSTPNYVHYQLEDPTRTVII